MVIDEVDQGCLQVVAETAAARIGIAEPASEDAQRQLLRELGGDVRVADGTQQVAVDHCQIPLDQGREGRVGSVGLAAVRLDHHRPLSGHLAEVLGQLIAVHPISSLAVSQSWGCLGPDEIPRRSGHTPSTRC